MSKRILLADKTVNLMAIGFRIVDKEKDTFLLRLSKKYWKVDVYYNEGWYVNLSGALPRPRESIEGKQAFDEPEIGVLKALEYLQKRCPRRKDMKDEVTQSIISLQRQIDDGNDTLSEEDRYRNRIKRAIGRYAMSQKMG